MIAGITLTREPLQTLRVDAIGYGAKDTGEMGGGAAAAVLAAAGPELLPELQRKLAGRQVRVGDVVTTGAFQLQETGVRWIVHIVSIIKNTPQGAYCPQPERLRDGVCSALTAVDDLGVRSVAFSALGTGEGRVEPQLAARYMLEGVIAFQQNQNKATLPITFSLPSYRDYTSFLTAIQSH